MPDRAEVSPRALLTARAERARRKAAFLGRVSVVAVIVAFATLAVQIWRLVA